VPRLMGFAGPAILLLVVGGISSASANRVVVPDGAALQDAVDSAAHGDVLVVQGNHYGSVKITRSLTLQGEPGAALIGNGQGNVITIAAPGVILRGFTIRGSGKDLEAMDAGVFVEQSARDAVVEQNQIEGNLYGIYLHGAENALARGNQIAGLQEGRVNESGNGVSVWNAPGAKVLDNDIRFGRDGIFVIASRNNVFRGNRFHDLRFAVHYMYTNDSEISDNVSTGNAMGFAIMFSHRLTVRGNLSDGDRDYGLLFNFANGSDISANIVRGRLQPASRWARGSLHNKETSEHGLPLQDEPKLTLATGARNGPEKCVFIYNSNQNRFRDNWFEGCEIGIHFTAGSEGNQIEGNAFVKNRNQVKYVGSRYLDWSKDGRGNYWSDNPGFDLDGDGIADTAYRPNDLVDKVLWTAPQAKILANSPAVQVLRWAQSQFPALLPGGVVDGRPLMSPPKLPVAGQGSML
jgi:nitrous oxidase accessory protein